MNTITITRLLYKFKLIIKGDIMALNIKQVIYDPTFASQIDLEYICTGYMFDIDETKIKDFRNGRRWRLYGRASFTWCWKDGGGGCQDHSLKGQGGYMGS